ncbi:MAG: CRISPR system precrRNA processing endoribonuclease RAMP protein Cas6 [Syntrophomonadaceae bacterium]
MAVDIIAEDQIILPAFKGSTFRGAIGNSLKNMVCIRRDRDCGSCLIKHKCSYTFLFETSVFMDKKALPAGVPQPFVLEPPLEEKEVYEPGELISFALVLIGKGIDHLPYFLATFDRMSQRGLGRGKGKFTLHEVRDGYSYTVVYNQADGIVNPNISRKSITEDFTSGQSAQMRYCKIQFKTPLRLKNNGQLSDRIDFEILMRAILRRINSLSYYFADEALQLNQQGLVSKAKSIGIVNQNIRWLDWERYSNRQNNRMKLGGIVGLIEFEGDLNPFWPLLLAGQEIHIGKNTTFGLGMYKLTTGFRNEIATSLPPSQ